MVIIDNNPNYIKTERD